MAGKALLKVKKSQLFALNAKRFWHVLSSIFGSVAQQFTAEKQGKYGLLDRVVGSGESQGYHLLTRQKALQIRKGAGLGEWVQL